MRTGTMYPQSARYTLLIRVDGNEKIGSGHLTRCMALASMVKAQFDVRFVCKDIPDTFLASLPAKGIGCTKIGEEEDFFAMLPNTDAVLLDGYYFDTAYQAIVKNAGCTLICIDDIADKEFVADLIINHTPGLQPGLYHAAPYTRFALGLNYALLRPSFLQQASLPRTINGLRSVMICFGGSDPGNLTRKTLQLVMEYDQFETIHVITGAMYRFADTLLSDLPATQKKIQHHSSLSEEEMLEIMLASDLAIVPSSVILFETIAAKCKVVSGFYVENQKFVYQNFLSIRAFYDAARFGKTDLRKAIDECLSTTTVTEPLIDGQSGKRIAAVIKNTIVSGKIELRCINEEDLAVTAGWADNEIIRKYSFNNRPIAKKEHEAWFKRKIQDPECVYLIAEVDGVPVGSIRFDVEDTEATISFLIDPEWHGMGLGRTLLSKGTEYFRNAGKVNTVIGFVKQDNIASLKAFRYSGFKETVEAGAIKFILNFNRI